jgi:hypothetical protein
MSFMMRERWSEADITAYLDGQLERERLAAFEKALARSNDLRQRVNRLRKTLALLRETPLRATPRNYLLTPSMVVDSKPVRQAHPRSLGFMRLATSLTAAAFVVTLGLNVLSRGYAPTTLMKQEESLQLMESVEGMQEGTGEEIIRESETPLVMMAADTPTLEAEPVQEETLAVEKPAAEMEGEAPASEEVMEAAPPADVEAGDAIGVGGGEAQPEAPLAEEALKVAPEYAVETDEAANTEGEAVQPEPLDVQEVPGEEGGHLGAVEGDESERTIGEEAKDETGELIPGEEVRALTSPVTEQDEVQSRNLFWSLARTNMPGWIPLSLGVITLLLLGVTLIISFRRR